MEDFPCDDEYDENVMKGRGIFKDILNDREFMKKISELSAEKNIPESEILEDSEKYLKEMYATQNKFTHTTLVKFFKFLVGIGFDKKINIDENEMKNLVEIMKKKPVAFVSSHKSYLDLIVFCLVLAKYNLPLPFIFSGSNLNMPILGNVMKKGGVIFIKRNSKDDFLYKLVLKRFIKWLMNKKSHFMWAIEGTRTRTGKILPPKMGILKYLSEQDITYIPVSIVYDLIPDLDDMLVEARGKNKKPETVEWVIDYFKKICSYGRGQISIRFGNYLQKSEEISGFANKIIKTIDDITPVTMISLICSILLAKISCGKNELDYNISILIKNIPTRLLTSKNIHQSLRLLLKEDILRQHDNRYIINHYKHFQAMYYANMSMHHLYHYAFVEMVEKDFWPEINSLKEFFYFEFIYGEDFEENIEKCKSDPSFNFAPLVLTNCLESYLVVSETLLYTNTFLTDPDMFLEKCLFKAQELHLLGKIKRIDIVSAPFLQNGIELVKRLKIDTDTKKVDFNIRVKGYIKRVKAILKNGLKFKEIIQETKIQEIKEIKVESGSHIGAFFDLDKTLIKGNSATSFIKKRLLSGKFKSQEIINQFLGLIQYIYDHEKFEDMMKLSIKGITGVKEKEFIDLGQQLKNDIIIYEEAIDLVSFHIERGHTVCIISAASIYQVDCIAKKLNIKNIECTRFEVEDEKFTGNIINCCWGKEKLNAGKRLAELHNLDLSKSYFYTDSIEDLSLLEIVGHPRPINPDANLLDVANKRGWSVQNFEDDREFQVENVIRTFLSYTLLVPHAIKGLYEGDRYTSLASIGDLATSIGGISINVIGEDIIWKHRPAVFIFNHQSHVDMIIVIKLIKSGATAIARKEIKEYPIIGQLLDSVGTIFIDTQNRNQAINAMQPAVDGLKNGTSLVIFPEGTRSYTRALGDFKKGAFHIAMQAGVPIIPIVIKNSHDIMPRDTFTIIPGIVNVTVLDPISTVDWTLLNLNDKIRDVRNLYLRELDSGFF